MEKAMKFTAIVFVLAVVLSVLSYGKEDTKEEKETTTSAASQSEQEKTNGEEKTTAQLKVGSVTYFAEGLN